MDCATPDAVIPPDLPSLLRAARQALTEGDHRQGLEQARRAAALAAPGSAEAVDSVRLQGHHLFRQGAFEEAARAAREALEGARGRGDAEARCDTLCLLAVALSELGLHEEALKRADQAFELARERGLEAAQTQALNRVGICHERLGDPEHGERFLLQALARAREQRSFDDTLVALNNLAATTIAARHLLQRRGDADAAALALQRARGYATQALSMARRSGGLYRQVVTLGNLGEVQMLAGEPDDAEQTLRQVLQQAQAQGFRAVELRTRHQLGELRALQGRHAEAVAELEPVLAMLEQGEHETTRLRVHGVLYRAHKALGRYEQALAHCEAHHAIELRRAGMQSRAQARLLVSRADMEQALQSAEHAQRESAELAARNEQLQRDALDDPLTGLANRRRIDQELPRLFAAARDGRRPIALAVIDVDRFKRVNDRFGHGVGDEVLAAVAALLRERLRACDFAARLGGEEFLVVLVDAPPALAADVCERLRATVEQHDWARLADGLAVTLSVGLVDAAADPSPHAALQRADAALYRAKRGGRNRVVLAR